MGRSACVCCVPSHPPIPSQRIEPSRSSKIPSWLARTELGLIWADLPWRPSSQNQGRPARELNAQSVRALLSTIIRQRT